MNLVNLKGLIRLVNGCTKPESQPFKEWVADVTADGAPVYVLP
jgi:prophage antirepressor-like protein